MKTLIFALIFALCAGSTHAKTPTLHTSAKVKPTKQITTVVKRRAHARMHKDKLVEFVKNHKHKKTSDAEAHRIVNACLRTEDPLFYLSLIKTESSYYPRATSKVGAMGLGQVMYSVHHKSLKREGIIKTKADLYTIENNVRASEHVYSNYLEESKGSHPKALSRYLGCHSRKYIRKTLETYSHLKRITGTT